MLEKTPAVRLRNRRRVTMSYVPIVPRSDRTRISPRARELAAQIDKLVQDFQRSYPDTRPTDVQEALRVASGSPDTVPGSRRVLAVALAVGVAVLVGGLAFVGDSGSSSLDLPANFMLWLVAGVIIVLALVARARRS
jgi:hypothetical protein